MDQPVERSILVVEDDTDLQFILQVTLEALGHQVVGVGSAEDAEPLLRDADLVMLDVRLPGMSGLDLLGRFHGEAGMPPIVVMSAHADRRVADEALRLGAVAFMRKPFEPLEVSEAVTHWLSSNGS